MFTVNAVSTNKETLPLKRATAPLLNQWDSRLENSQLCLTVSVCLLQESEWTLWISTRTKGSRALPLRGTGRLEPLITFTQGTGTETGAVSVFPSEHLTLILSL